MSSLTKNDYLMILALESDPLMSLKDLSRKINISWPTVKKRFEDVVARGVIRSPRARTLTEELGLKRVNVFAQVDNFQSLTNLEQGCNIHPYTKYRSRMIGDHIGLYIQYEIPATTLAKSNLEVYYSRLQNMNIISEYSFQFETGIRHEGFPDLTRFDLDKYSWDFTWEQWFDNLENPLVAELPLPKVTKDNFEEFTTLRLDMLAILTENASMKQADFMTQFNLSRTEASRQYNFVMDNFVRSIRLNYDRDAFDLTETFLFLLKDVSIKQQAALYSNISQNLAPFRFSIEILEDNNVLLWGNMSMNHSNKFIFKLWNQFPKMKVWRLSTNDDGAMQYYFYPPNFNFETRKWKDSQNYMIEEPLNELKEA